MGQCDVPGLIDIELLQRQARPRHAFIHIGDVSFHGMIFSGVSNVLFTRSHGEASEEAIRNAKDPRYHTQPGSGYLSLWPMPGKNIYEAPLFKDPIWPAYEPMSADEMDMQRVREEDLLFRAILEGGSRYISTRWALSNTCHHFLAYALNALIELDTHHWIIPSNWQTALDSTAVDLVEGSLTVAKTWRTVGKLLGRWRPMPFPWFDRDNRKLKRQYDARGKLVESEAYVDA
jgi:hypothetical protein